MEELETVKDPNWLPPTGCCPKTAMCTSRSSSKAL